MKDWPILPTMKHGGVDLFGHLANTESLLNARRESVEGPLEWGINQVVERLVDGISVDTTGAERK